MDQPDTPYDDRGPAPPDPGTSKEEDETAGDGPSAPAPARSTPDEGTHASPGPGPSVDHGALRSPPPPARTEAPDRSRSPTRLPRGPEAPVPPPSAPSVAAETPAAAEADDTGSPPPRSVREVMKGSPSESSSEREDRVFQDAEGTGWLARINGTSSTGAPLDAGAPLVLLRFYKEVEPDAPAREIMVVTRALEELYDEELRTLLSEAGPARTVLPKRPQKSRSRKRRRK